jgi:hypothetical protein
MQMAIFWTHILYGFEMAPDMDFQGLWVGHLVFNIKKQDRITFSC